MEKTFSVDLSASQARALLAQIPQTELKSLICGTCPYFNTFLDESLDDPEQQYVTFKEALKMVGCSKPTLYKLLLTKKIFGRRHFTSGHWQVSVRSIVAHVDEEMKVNSSILD